MQFSRRQAFIALCLLALIPLQAGAQCVMCGTVGQGPDDPLVKGMFRSIIFMLLMPFTLLCSVGGWLAYKLRDQAEDGESIDSPEPDPAIDLNEEILT